MRVTVIGAGPGGYTAALSLARQGAEVVLVERSKIGGVCLNWGCIPTKTLKATADAIKTLDRMAEFGLTGGGRHQADLKAVMARKNQVIETLTGGVERLLSQAKVKVLFGRARILSPTLVGVEREDGRDLEVPGDKILVAAGSLPGELPGLVHDGLKVLNSDDALVMSETPESLAIVGGGVVGCEFAFIFNALGAKVTLVEALERLLPLPGLDPDASRILAREMKKQGIKVHTGKVIKNALVSGKEVSLRLGASPLIPEGAAPVREADLAVDQILVSVGRLPAGAGLGLAEAGVDLGDRGAVLTDAGLKTSVPQIYAVGDILGPRRPMLAHVAQAEAMVAAANITGRKKTMSYQVVPSTVFTTPEVAWVGMNREAAAGQGIDAVEHVFPFRLLGKSQAMGEIAGQCKLVSEKKSGRLLGAQIIGAHASDLIHECALGIRLKAGVKDLAETIHSHPTLSEAIYEAALGAAGLGGHGA